MNPTEKLTMQKIKTMSPRLSLDYFFSLEPLVRTDGLTSGSFAVESNWLSLK